MWCQKSACHWMAGQCCHLAIHETASFTKITSSIFETCQWGKYIFLKQQQEKKPQKTHNIVFWVFFLPFSLDSVDMTRDCWKVIDGATGRRGGGRGNWGNYIGGLVRGGSGGEKNKNKKKNATGGFGQQWFSPWNFSTQDQVSLVGHFYLNNWNHHLK